MREQIKGKIDLLSIMTVLFVERSQSAQKSLSLSLLAEHISRHYPDAPVEILKPHGRIRVQIPDYRRKIIVSDELVHKTTEYIAKCGLDDYIASDRIRVFASLGVAVQTSTASLLLRKSAGSQADILLRFYPG